jgi:hypothetical protein
MICHAFGKLLESPYKIMFSKGPWCRNAANDFGKSPVEPLLLAVIFHSHHSPVQCPGKSDASHLQRRKQARWSEVTWAVMKPVNGSYAPWILSFHSGVLCTVAVGVKPKLTDHNRMGDALVHQGQLVFLCWIPAAHVWSERGYVSRGAHWNTQTTFHKVKRPIPAVPLKVAPYLGG